MAVITINQKEYSVADGTTIIKACELANIEIPRFCYHEKLKIAGNCRMCLVEVEGGAPKPVASCATPVVNGMKIHTDTPMVKKAREGVMEFLLANHPLDCPICDQGGECDLQDQAYQYGKGKSAYHENRRAVKDKDMGPIVKTQMTRCIHCTRCIRFMEDIAGTTEMGAVSRGEDMQIATYLEKSIKSELSGNIIDLCPVGALTFKPYAFKARSWELKKTKSVDVMDAFGSSIRIDSRGNEVMRILPFSNDEINEEWISDKTRCSYEGFKYQRLTSSYVRGEESLQAVDFDKALDAIKEKLSQVKPSEVAALSGEVSSVDEIFALKKFMTQFGSENFDCRLNGENLTAADRASYLFNNSIVEIESADFCLLVGVNPRKDAPVLNARIRKAVVENKMKVAAIGVDADLTYDFENLGSDASLLKSILDGNSKISKDLESAKKPILILGNDAVSRNDGAAILAYCKAIAEKKMNKNDRSGFNFLSKSTGLINGLSVGFTGSSTSQILEKAAKGEVKVIFLHNVDDIDFSKLKNCFVIYIGSNGDNGAHAASVILPGLSPAEKSMIYVNIEGRAQETSIAVSISKLKNDIEIIAKLAQKIGVDAGFTNDAELRRQLLMEYPIFLNLEKIVKSEFVKSEKLDGEFSSEKLIAKDYDFYLTNSIARSSPTLHKASVAYSS